MEENKIVEQARKTPMQELLSKVNLKKVGIGLGIAALVAGVVGVGVKIFRDKSGEYCEDCSEDDDQDSEEEFD